MYYLWIIFIVLFLLAMIIGSLVTWIGNNVTTAIMIVSIVAGLGLLLNVVLNSMESKYLRDKWGRH